MADYITLLGSEEISRAGHNMLSAADTMLSAANAINEAHCNFLSRLEQILADDREARREL